MIEAARRAFAEHGVHAQMEDVARRAGVGVGTVYRHFDTKEALLDAALEARFGEALQLTRAAAEIEDPWRAVVAAFTAVAELNAHDRGFSRMIGEQLTRSEALKPVMEELWATWGNLIARAQRAGVMRPDVDVGDLPALMCALANVVIRAEDARGWRRYLTIVTDGLRADAFTKMPA